MPVHDTDIKIYDGIVVTFFYMGWSPNSAKLRILRPISGAVLRGTCATFTQ